MSGILIREVEYRGKVTDLLLEGCNMHSFSGPAPSGVQVVEGKGLLAIPGLVDNHVHFRDPGLTEKEDLLTGARAAAAGGYCCVVCEPNTRPVIDNADAVKAFDKRVRDLGIPINVLTKSALTLGQQGEVLVDISALESLVTSFSDDGEPMYDPDLLAHALDKIRSLPEYLEITAHCEETPRSSERVKKAFGEGPAMEREAEIIAQHLKVLNDHPGALHIQHISLAKSVELLAASKRNRMVTAEVTPHHLLMCKDDIPDADANWKMNPPLRSREDMLAMRSALAKGVIDYIATDHAPHTPAEKSKPWDEAPFGVIGLETALGACLTLVHSGELSLERLVEAMTHDSVLPPSAAGVTMPSFWSGITLVDLNKEWVVEPEKFYSKGRNCPFAGMKFKGKAVYTIVNGRIVMAEGKVLF